MERKTSVVTSERFASGMTFDQYVTYVGTPENLKREGSGGRPRSDMSANLRAGYAAARLDDAQTAAIKWLASRPNGPAKVLVISEEWSSDCRRDVPIWRGWSRRAVWSSGSSAATGSASARATGRASPMRRTATPTS